jgi:hypothetical protein
MKIETEIWIGDNEGEFPIITSYEPITLGDKVKDKLPRFLQKIFKPHYNKKEYAVLST